MSARTCPAAPGPRSTPGPGRCGDGGAGSLRACAGAWEGRSFRLFFFGRGISAVGDRIVSVALAFAVLDLTGSVKDLGLVLAAQTVPLVLFLLIGGVWSDRLPRRAVMIASDLVRAGAQGASALLLVSGTAHVWQLVVLQAAHGTADAFFEPAAQALLPETVAAADLQQANALIAVSTNVANVGGPALAGVLVATLGAGWGLAIDAGSFLASAAYLSLMRVQAIIPAARTGTLSELRSGWRAFRSRTWLWVSALEFMAANALFSAYLVLGPQVARTSLGGPGAWAAISTASGIGAVLGGTLGLRWNPRYPLRAMFVTSLVGTSPLLVLLAAVAPLPVLLAAAVISGMSVSFFNLVWFAVVQRRIPGRELSRVSSWDALGSYAITPVGLAAAGPIGIALGISTTLYAAAALGAIGTVAVLAVPSVRNLTGQPAGGEELPRSLPHPDRPGP
ncbi:MAG: MFS transporter [Solirubrobacteraceae bacterium]